MTWFKHRCWFCGLKSRYVDFIVSDGNYQCEWDERESCQTRRNAKWG